MRATLFALVLLAAVAGCRTRPLDDSRDGGACSTDRRLTPVLIESITPEDLNVWDGVFGRARITFRHLSCAPAVSPTVTLDPSRRVVVITARVFSRPDDLTNPACVEVVDKQTVFVTDVGPFPVGMLALRDGAPGGVAATEMPIQLPPFMVTCTRMADAPCRLDCHCATAPNGADRCWADDGNCVRTCRVDADCGPDAPMCDDGLCFASGPGCAAAGARCELGARCGDVGGHAVCKPAKSARAGTPCAVDADCDFGAVCSGCACVLPCVSDADCASGRCTEGGTCGCTLC